MIAATKIVGGACYRKHFLSDSSTGIELTGLGSYQRSSAGRQLLCSVEVHAPAIGCRAVILLAVPGAARFYERSGYSYLLCPHNNVDCDSNPGRGWGVGGGVRILSIPGVQRPESSSYAYTLGPNVGIVYVYIYTYTCIWSFLYVYTF